MDIGSLVVLVETGESGTIDARTTDPSGRSVYRVDYVTKDGESREGWFDLRAISLAD